MNTFQLRLRSTPRVYCRGECQGGALGNYCSIGNRRPSARRILDDGGQAFPAAIGSARKALIAQVELLASDEHLRHYADMRISLDLDDGVKVNYGKFGDLLAEVKPVTGRKAN